MNSKLNTSIFAYNAASPGDMVEFQNAHFYAYDNSKSSQNGPVVGVVSVTLTGAQATNLLNNFLLVNVSGNKSAEARVLSTEQVHQLGIHHDILRLIPWLGFSSSSRGEMPRKWIESVLEYVAGYIELGKKIGEILYQGLIAIAHFFEELGDTLKAWGQKLLGSLSDTAQAVKDAVQAVVDALNAIVVWLIKTAQELIMPIQNTINDAIEKWKNEMSDAITLLYNDASEHNMVISESNKSRFIVLIIENLILPLIILSIVLGIIEIILQPFSPFALVVLMAVVMALVLTICHHLWFLHLLIQVRLVSQLISSKCLKISCH
jgi:gas vesicle protein